MAMLAAFIRNPDRTRFETQEPGETIVLLLRAHPITTLRWFLLAIILAVLPFFIYFNISFFGFSPTDPTVIRGARIIIVVWELFVLGFVIEQFLLYYFNVYIVTNLRVIDISFTNLLNKKVAETQLGEIEDASFTQNGVLRSIFNYGDVLVQTAGSEQEFTFYAVPHPGEVVTIIQELEPHTNGE